MVNSDINYFSFYFSGESGITMDIELVRTDLMTSLPNDKNIFENIVFGKELLIKDNLDFEGIVNYIKVFRRSGVSYRIAISDSKNFKGI